MIRRITVIAAIACASAQTRLPAWTAPRPNASLPHGGFPVPAGLRHALIYNSTPEVGTYNHAAMLTYHNGSFLLTFKNSPVDEDAPGQRVLYSTSTDGLLWSVVNTETVLFPNMSTSSNPAHLFAEPSIVIGDRLYAAASPIQFCLYPDEYASVLLLRRVTLPAEMGPVFWAGPVPPGFEEASTLRGVSPLDQMDAVTRADVAALLAPVTNVLPCDPLDGSAGGVRKCEACVGGCQRWADIAPGVLTLLANERTHFQRAAAAGGGVADDVLLYRSKANHFYASVRTGGLNSTWSVPVVTDIPDDNSNLNAGTLPDGRVFLLSNSVQRPSLRDPITLALSRDGVSFDAAWAVVSCADLAVAPNVDPCTPRYKGEWKNPGPSYPQGVVMSAPAPAALRGLWIVHCNNKEDIWVSFVPERSV